MVRGSTGLPELFPTTTGPWAHAAPISKFFRILLGKSLSKLNRKLAAGWPPTRRSLLSFLSYVSTEEGEISQWRTSLAMWKVATFLPTHLSNNREDTHPNSRSGHFHRRISSSCSNLSSISLGNVHKVTKVHTGFPYQFSGGLPKGFSKLQDDISSGTHQS